MQDLVEVLQGIPNHLLYYYLSIFEMKMEFKWQALYDRKRHCSTLIWPQRTPEGKKILLHIFLTPQLYPRRYTSRYSTSENVVQVTYFTEKRKQCLSTLIWRLRIKRRFRNLIAHLKDLPYQTLWCHFSSPEYVDRASVTTTSPKRQFDLNWPRVKYENSKS